ncbi:MAG: DsrE/DsrF/DrsH-like family protein [Methanomassiliicoccales archaeon]|nr:DsrE/DsrF/DrsH-like family protein [Methanomassiliicoccales archaeon]
MPKLTLVVFSGDFDRAFVAFTIASRAAAEGWDVLMLFTFWGLGIVRDPNRMVPKTAEAEKAFDSALARGADDLRLSQASMADLGTTMMKEQMSAKKMLPIREMMKEAKEFGVKFLVCNIPMELMGIRREEFVDEVDEVCSVGRYLEEAKDADVNLFI